MSNGPNKKLSNMIEAPTFGFHIVVDCVRHRLMRKELTELLISLSAELSITDYDVVDWTVPKSSSVLIWKGKTRVEIPVLIDGENQVFLVTHPFNQAEIELDFFQMEMLLLYIMRENFHSPPLPLSSAV
jgi:hypothetical protein